MERGLLLARYSSVDCEPAADGYLASLALRGRCGAVESVDRGNEEKGNEPAGGV